MKPLSKKLMAVVMALVLGLLPLQGVLASAKTVPSQGMTHQDVVHHPVGQEDATVAAKVGMDMTGKTMADGCCAQNDSASGHCSVCSSVPPSMALSTPLPLADFNPPCIKLGALHHITSSLFRPPRA